MCYRLGKVIEALVRHMTWALALLAAITWAVGAWLSLAGRKSFLALLIDLNSKLPSDRRLPLLGWNPVTWLRFNREMKTLKADESLRKANKRYLTATVIGAVLMTAGVLLAAWLFASHPASAACRSCGGSAY